jgi:hypothetical protein
MRNWENARTSGRSFGISDCEAGRSSESPWCVLAFGCAGRKGCEDLLGCVCVCGLGVWGS